GNMAILHKLRAVFKPIPIPRLVGAKSRFAPRPRPVGEGGTVSASCLETEQSGRGTVRRRVLWRLGGVLAAVVLVLLGDVGHVVVGGNFHEVVPGEVYRSAQLSPQTLEGYIRARGIRTVINLRGENFDEDWYHNEKAACVRAGATFEDVGLWAYQPSPQG